jgi:peptide/nickel transport system permease protein
MLRIIGRRLLAVIPMLFIMSIIVFSLVLVVPGDPAVTLAGDNATEEQIGEIRARLGLDKPIVEQYLDWLGGVVQGDFGTSLLSSRGVAETIWSKLPVSLSLAFSAIFVGLAIGLPAGIVAALRRNRWPDRVSTVGASIGMAMPNFWLGLVFVVVFAVNNPWFPASGYVRITEDPWEWLRHLVLPALTLGTAAAAEITRQLRGSLSDVLDQDYVRTAEAKGLRRWVVIGKHAAKNASIPVVTVLGLQFSLLLGGTVAVERVFGIPGLGTEVVDAVLAKDLPMIQGIVFFTTFAVIIINLFVDITYGFLNPKVRGR